MTDADLVLATGIVNAALFRVAELITAAEQGAPNVEAVLVQSEVVAMQVLLAAAYRRGGHRAWRLLAEHVDQPVLA